MAKKDKEGDYGDFGYAVKHSALYRASKQNPNEPLTRSDMNKARKEIDREDRRHGEYR